ncbi:hypothetical protein XENOCAPTIV_019464 [Xenoophorus captivus]|uniref:Uncharacterized protein n=1 Tax=Xenoophorus captivus TaxID=1517983 RepID=A0ABV0RSU5_9TELE
MRMMGTPNLIADTMDCGLSYSVISYLKKLSQQVKNHSSSLSLAHRRDFKQLLQGITGEGPLRLVDINFKEFAGFQIALLNKDVKPQAYRNAYDIPRRNLLDQLTRMRTNLLRTSFKLIRGQDEGMSCLQEFVAHKNPKETYLLCLRLVFSIVFPGTDGSSIVVTESNGDGILGLDSGEIWPTEVDTEVMKPTPLVLDDKAGIVASFQDEETSMVEDELVEDNLEEQLMEEGHNYNRLSPQSELDSTEDDLAVLSTIYITPLDGCQAELRSRVIKEVRKPGQSE